MKENPKTSKIPERKDVPAAHRWRLSKLYSDDGAWEAGLLRYKEMADGIEAFQGKLGRSAADLSACLDFMMELGKLEERLGYYAHLRLSEDGGDASNQDRYARYLQNATKADALASYQKPEIQAIPDETMKRFWPELKAYHIFLSKLLRYKPHILGEKEEKLLSLQEEANQTSQKAFSALTDVDMEFGTVSTDAGEKPLTQSTYQAFLVSPNRGIRKEAYEKFLSLFDGHKNTLVSLYAGSVHLDIYLAKARSFPSARAMKLFPDDVPEQVYDNLVASVGRSLPVLHKYYELRRRVLGLEKLRIFDTKVSLVKNVQIRHTYEEAVKLVIDALAPLGEEYLAVLRTGLVEGWVDRYENKGKRSGAFSAGSYAGDPYILMNFKEDLLRDVFTLAHEAGHSMHSHYSVRANPFQHYSYSIFEAEVASTFNEELLMEHLLKTSESADLRLYLVNKHVDDIIATLFRQTMFAEFEHLAHAMVEKGEPLTVASVRAVYRGLLEKYFGPSVEIGEPDDLEGLRIPHFYRSFYVYKYATGIAASLALSKRVLSEGEPARKAYFDFLASGGSRFPLDSLRLAGVDMASPEPVDEALRLFAGLVEELEKNLMPK